MRNVHCELRAGFGKPNRVKMRFDEIAICKLQSRRPDNTANHRDWPVEVILVMRPLRRAIGDNQRRLT